MNVLDFGAATYGGSDAHSGIQAAMGQRGQSCVGSGWGGSLKNSLLPHEGQTLEIHGTHQIADAVVSRLLADLETDEDTHKAEDAVMFHVGQNVMLHDDSLPI